MLNAPRYITDDRDRPDDEQFALEIFHGGNGDYYVSVPPKNGHTVNAVRLCTSGGAMTACPGLVNAIHDAYRALQAYSRGERSKQPTSAELRDEIEAWRSAFPDHVFEFGRIYKKET